jgi:hypothetical protein
LCLSASPTRMYLHTSQYAVALCAPTLGFVPRMPGKRRERDAPLGTVEVGIASVHARGMPRPVAVGSVSYGPPQEVGETQMAESGSLEKQGDTATGPECRATMSLLPSIPENLTRVIGFATALRFDTYIVCRVSEEVGESVGRVSATHPGALSRRVVSDVFHRFFTSDSLDA